MIRLVNNTAETKNQIAEKEAGFISLFSVLIIMAILTLIAIGFSSVTRRAQQRVLDNQLNVQAFYAAESGVNEARTALAANPGLTKTTCQGGSFTGYNNGIDAGLNVGYTCLLINPLTQDLQFNSIPVEGMGNPRVIPLESTTTAINYFTLSWDAASAASPLPSLRSGAGVGGFAPSTTWGTGVGMIRAELVPTDGALDRNTLRAGFSFYLFPSADSGSSYPTALNFQNNIPDQGGVQTIRCTPAPVNGYRCRAKVWLNGVAGSHTKYMLRLQSLYNPTKVSISEVRTTANGANLTLQNGQATVDVTGKANDVFRRIQVRVPLLTRGLNPGLALLSGDSICKRILAAPNPPGSSTDNSGTFGAPDFSNGGACTIPTAANP